MTQTRHLALWGAVCAFLAVAAGAFGAHGLRPLLTPQQFDVYQTAVTYQMWHALAMVLCAALVQSGLAGVGARRAGWLFLVGILLFSGSLYALTFTGIRNLGIITPFGGVCFLAGWLLLGLNLWNRKSKL